MKGDPVAANLKLSGGLRGDRWRGALSELKLKTPLRRWELSAPWALDLDLPRQRLTMGISASAPRGQPLRQGQPGIGPAGQPGVCPQPVRPQASAALAAGQLPLAGGALCRRAGQLARQSADPARHRAHHAGHFWPTSSRPTISASSSGWTSSASRRRSGSTLPPSRSATSIPSSISGIRPVAAISPASSSLTTSS